MKSALLVTAATLALWGAAPASAATYKLTINDFQDVDTGMTGNSITAQLTTSGQMITSITGTVDEGGQLEPIDGLTDYFAVFGDATPYFNSTSDYLVAFQEGYDDFNIGPNGSIISLEEVSFNGDITEGVTGSISLVSAVPLPASLPMFGTALLGLGVVGYSLKRSRKAALTA